MPTDVELYHDKQGRTRGIAFVTFDSVQTSIQAKNILCASKFVIENREVVVEYFQNNRTSSESNGATSPLTLGAGTVSCTHGGHNNMGTLNKDQQFESNKNIDNPSSPYSKAPSLVENRRRLFIKPVPHRQRAYNNATPQAEHLVSQWK